MKQKTLLTFALTVLFAANSFTHEYWFEPESFFPAPNEKTAVHLYVGDGLSGKDREEKMFQAEKTSQFKLYSAEKAFDLKASLIEAALPVYNFSAEKPGNHWLAMERNWSYIKLEPAKFEAYLREDGLEYIIAERAKAGESAAEGAERYSRFIKTLLQVGDRRDGVYKTNLGLRLEILPLENPYAKKVGDKLKFQVMFDGKPLADRTVFAENRGSKKQKMTTDGNGKFTVAVGKNGLLLIRLVNMQRCAADCGDAVWESFWGAVTFGVQ